jgi:type III restriction enzyme
MRCGRAIRRWRSISIVIAPNLTVFERLKEDFKPEGGGPDIFDTDPLIPVEWRGDWNLTTVLTG